jgi:hypothetical protein
VQTARRARARASEYARRHDVIRAPGPGGSVRLIHLSGRVYVVRPEDVAAVDAILGVTGAGTGAPASDALLAGLLKERLIRPTDAAPRPGSALRSALADRVLGSALVRSARVRDPRRQVQRLLRAARWAVVVFGWAETVRVWERCYPQPPATRRSPTPLDEIDRRVRRAAAHSLAGHRCKERALACLALARASGHRADLVIGVSDFPVAAHVWTDCLGRIISDEPAYCAGFRPIARWDGSGAARSA